MSDHHNRPEQDYPEELPEILEPEVEAVEEEKEEETTLPVPSDLDLVQRYIREANRYS